VVDVLPADSGHDSLGDHPVAVLCLIVMATPGTDKTLIRAGYMSLPKNSGNSNRVL
jgi:hypothetical protein